MNNPKKKHFTHFTEEEDDKIINSWKIHYERAELISKYILTNRSARTIAQHITKSLWFQNKLRQVSMLILELLKILSKLINSI